MILNWGHAWSWTISLHKYLEKINADIVKGRYPNYSCSGVKWKPEMGIMVWHGLGNMYGNWYINYSISHCMMQ